MTDARSFPAQCLGDRLLDLVGREVLGNQVAIRSNQKRLGQFVNVRLPASCPTAPFGSSCRNRVCIVLWATGSESFDDSVISRALARPRFQSTCMIRSCIRPSYISIIAIVSASDFSLSK
jgi:hypothetical protein